MRKKIVVLGSTGSVGTQALQVIAANPDQFELLAISAHTNYAKLCEQAKTFNPLYAGMASVESSIRLKEILPQGVKLLTGERVNEDMAAIPEADIVLVGVSGLGGLGAVLAALRQGKTVALANKESIVCGYELIKRTQMQYGGQVLPVDSEHSALFQCLQNGERKAVEALHLTASGGSFWQLPQEELKNITVEQALNHPVWRMGNKISIDSATLINKGLEVIEASFLFDIPQSNIFVLIHPQSIVHSMVEYCDGTMIAQLSSPDMRLAIQYALTYPARGRRQIPRLSLSEVGKLTFFCGDDFPAIRMAHDALKQKGCAPAVYCAANDIAVEAFLDHRISFADILHTVEYVMGKASQNPINSLEDLDSIFDEVKRLAQTFLAGRKG